MPNKSYRKRLFNPALLKLGFVAIIAPTLTSLGIDFEDITSWDKLVDVVKDIIMNPYLVGTITTGILMFLMDNKDDEVTSQNKDDGL